MNSLMPYTHTSFPNMTSTYFPTSSVSHSSYPRPFYGADSYPINELNRNSKPAFGEQFLSWINQLDSQYRHEQYLKQLDRAQKRYWKDQGNRLPPPMYTMTSAGTTMLANPSIIQYEQEIRYVPLPVYVTPGSGFGTGAGTYLPPLGTGIPGAGSLSTGLFGADPTMNLPPKIRVIFIPTGSSPMQQPFMGPLTMPPFLFNRMSQPLCSFPLPPPLPQVGSLPLAPGVQQMLMQRYVNPVAVLPFTPNYQMPQPSLPMYPPMMQMPMSSFQPVQSAPPPCIPALPAPSMPMMPAPSALPAMPPPAPAPLMQLMQATVPPVPPSSYVPPPAPLMPSLPPAPQAYIPPPSSAMNATAPIPQFMNNTPAAPAVYYPMQDFSNICRACPPAPPALNIPVSGHCWVQHCSACHHVPMPMDYANTRPSSGRITPLLRHPTVPQYIPDQNTKYQIPEPPVLMRPWLRKTPPLPPGAVLISDEYLDRPSQGRRSHRSPTQPKYLFRNSRYKERSTTATSTIRSVSTVNRTPENKSERVVRSHNGEHSNLSASKPPESSASRRAQSTSSANGTITPQSMQYEKVETSKYDTKENSIPQQLVAEARNVNLRYHYPAQELSSVYLKNRYITSSSEASSSLSTRTSQSPSLSLYSKSATEDTVSTKEEEKSALPPLPTKASKGLRIVIREYPTTSPSTISVGSSILSDVAFSIIGKRKNSDANSTTSTIKALQLDAEKDKKTVS